MVRSAVAGLLPDDCEIGVVDAACSSSLYAIDLGAKSLIARNCDIALCGGVSCVSPRYNVAFAKLGGLSRSGNVRVFDRAADGTLFSDGAAVVALKLLDRAVDDGDRILGVLAGFGASSDGRGKAVHAPNPVGQALCVERARHAGRIEADEVDWVIAHGTGTPVGDAVELRTLEDAAPPTGYLCTSNKSLVGHTGWSAGTVSVIHLLLALQHERIPAQRGFTEPADAAVKAGRVRVPRVSTPWPAVGGRPRVAGVSSFGFGGANAHLLIQEYAPDRAVRATVDLSTDPLVLVAWSAQLPGDPARTEIESMLTDDTKPRRRAFDSSYPIPPFEEIRLPPRTARAVDRSQLMALHVAALFVAEHGEIWAPVRNSTGVMAAHTGPLPSSADHLVRCYAADLGAFLTGADARAFTAVLDDVRRTTPPTGNDTLTGIMPNILAARLANRYDLHGPALVLDTGRTAGLTAVRVAARYLRARELDLALILGVNANSRPDLAALVGVPEDRLAEGAFLVALSRESVADDHGWPVLAHISVDETDPIPASVRITCGGKETDDRVSYLGADGVVALLRALCLGAPSATVVPAPGEVGPAVTVRRTGVRSTESSAT
jgi:acyl transferase domain-containing protein